MHNVMATEEDKERAKLIACKHHGGTKRRTWSFDPTKPVGKRYTEFVKT
jgi:hypothetical protein